VRLNARRHAGRLEWRSIVERFEGYLLEAIRQPLPAPANGTGALGADTVRK
jgi:hypothetical protein